mmetsp:Transcript_77724/g.137643  ORF Transcript_77724/g.137643 Transcript_77724/m.137643 type:complete len:488 (+) Transcript_77724:126-1589(+)
MGVQKREDESLGLAEPKLIQVEAYGGEAALSQLRDLVNQAIHSLASRLEVVERITIERSAEADLDNRIQKLDDTVSVLATKLEVAKKRWLDDSRRLWDAVDSHTHDVNEIEDGEEMQTLPAAVFRGHRPSDEDEAELNESQDPAQVSDRCDGEKFANMLLLQKELISSSKQAESVPESSSLPGSARVSQSPMPNFGTKTSPTSKSAQRLPSPAGAPPNVLMSGSAALRMIYHGSQPKVQRLGQRSVSPDSRLVPGMPIVKRSMSPTQKVPGIGTTTMLSGWSSPYGSAKLPGPVGYGSAKLPGPPQSHIASQIAQQQVSQIMLRSTTPGRTHVGTSIVTCAASPGAQGSSLDRISPLRDTVSPPMSAVGAVVAPVPSINLRPRSSSPQMRSEALRRSPRLVFNPPGSHSASRNCSPAHAAHHPTHQQVIQEVASLREAIQDYEDNQVGATTFRSGASTPGQLKPSGSSSARAAYVNARTSYVSRRAK